MKPTAPKRPARWPQKLAIYVGVALLFVLPREAGAEQTADIRMHCATMSSNTLLGH